MKFTRAYLELSTKTVGARGKNDDVKPDEKCKVWVAMTTGMIVEDRVVIQNKEVNGKLEEKRIYSRKAYMATKPEGDSLTIRFFPIFEQLEESELLRQKNTLIPDDKKAPKAKEK